MKILDDNKNRKSQYKEGKRALTDDIKVSIPDDVLKDKSIYAFGDSILYGHTEPDKSFPRLISRDYNMKLTMCAVNGATVIKGDNHILTQVKHAPDKAPDVILFDGYTNDAYVKTFDSIGEVQGGSATKFDNTTFCGGFEEILYTMKQKWPDTPIVFVTIHKSGGREWNIQCRLRELAMELCRQWDVRIADVFHDATLDTRDDAQMSQYIIGGAGSHPNESACRSFYIPVVVKKLKEVLADSLTTLSDNINDTVDLAVFAGQSNMSGRGNAADAVSCDMNAGFEYRAVSRPDMLVPITEPFGLNEDKKNGLTDIGSDGKTKRSGSMVSALVNEYYQKTGRQLVAVSASMGGTSTAQWKDNYISDATARLDAAKKFLQSNKIQIGRVFVVWCQGETDGDNMVSAQTYTHNTMTILDKFKAHGTGHCFLVQIGHYNYLDYPNGSGSMTGEDFDNRYQTIRRAQAALCEENDFVTCSASFEPHIENMIDQYHYNQTAYNEVGKQCGGAIAEFYK